VNRTARRAGDVVRLRAVQLLLLLLTGVWLWLGGSERYWPIVGWPMYDALTAARPDESVARVYVRVWMGDGSRRTLRQADLVEYSRAPLAGASVNAAMDQHNPRRRAAGQAHLASLVMRALGTAAIDSIALSQTVWAVRLGQVPPVDLARPLSSVPIAAFAVPR